MFDLNFKILGDQQYARQFDVLDSELGSLREPLGRVSRLLTSTVGENFQTEGGQAGGWQQLSPAYDRWKQEAYPGRPMMVLSGSLRQALLVDGERELTDRRLVWGITDQKNDDGESIIGYAHAHQHGEGNLPMRKVVSLTFDDRRQIDRLFVEWVAYVRRRVIR